MPDLFAEEIETDEGVVFEPMSTDLGVGYKITAPDGRVEYLFFAPSTGHESSNDSDAIADTFVYWVNEDGAKAWAEEQAGPGTGAALVDFAEPLIYFDHFETEEETDG